ncbi:hypothetical protein [Microbacterium thalli]|uniref:hypothetical protein n=1 Tax=Microbacterium thalli TaxID=3027921 RepID=UPI00236534A7|nr:hypothetical protein [Microbacterium thalli]MDD7930061.1 hypothetical protein [Microbacterium thalli]
MDRAPVAPEKRRVLEALIRVIDLIIYAAVGVAGVFAIVAPPPSVQTELAGWEWLITVWGALLILGGAGGFAGRLSRYWIVEVPALPFAGIGIGVYFLILGTTATVTPFTTVAAMIVLAAMLNMLRRYLELQIFASEPGDQDIRTLVAAILSRRTRDVVRRDA